MSYHASIVFNILFTTCVSFIVMCIDDYVITPIFRKPKEEVKKTTRKNWHKSKNIALFSWKSYVILLNLEHIFVIILASKGNYSLLLRKPE